MIFNIGTKIYGDRSAFGYLGSGEGSKAGFASAYDAVELLNEERKEYQWKYLRWDGDDLIVEFERKEGHNQMIETVVLRPENYLEFIVLKKWEKNNGFL